MDFRKKNPRFMEPNFSANMNAIKPFREFAASKNTSPAALAIAWLLAKGDHLIPIPGTRTIDHLREDAMGVELTLSLDDMAEIDRILPPGFAHGDRYSNAQWPGAERYC